MFVSIVFLLILLRWLFQNLHAKKITHAANNLNQLIRIRSTCDNSGIHAVKHSVIQMLSLKWKHHPSSLELNVLSYSVDFSDHLLLLLSQFMLNSFLFN